MCHALTEVRTRLGSFVCGSGALLVTDPCYPYRDRDAVHQSALWIEAAARGTWHAWVERIEDPEAPTPDQLRGLRVLHDGVVDDRLVWREVEGSLGFDTTQVGVFDADFYRDCPDVVAGLMAALCGPSRAGVVAGGASSGCCYDPSRVAVSVAERAGEVVGVATTWYSNQLRPRKYSYVIAGAEVELQLGDGVLGALMPGERWVEFGFHQLYFGDLDEIRAELQVPDAIWIELTELLRARGLLRLPRM